MKILSRRRQKCIALVFAVSLITVFGCRREAPVIDIVEVSDTTLPIDFEALETDRFNKAKEPQK